MGRLKINRGPPRPVKFWKLQGYYHSSKEMIKIIQKLKEECKYVYLRKLNVFIEKPYIIYTKC